MDNHSEAAETSDAQKDVMQINQTLGTLSAHQETEIQVQQIIRALGGCLSPIQIATLRCELGAAERRGRKAERDLIMLPASTLPGGVERLDNVNMTMLLRQTMARRNLPLLVAVATSMINRGMEMTKPNPFRKAEAPAAGAEDVSDGDRQ